MNLWASDEMHPKRLYRGLSRKHRPDQKPEPLEGTNFTDCPYSALRYATGSRGVLLVVDLPDEGSVHVHEAIWSIRPDPAAPRRFLLGRAFDRHITAELPATDLRKRLRRPGYSRMSDCSRSRILEYIIERMLEERARGELRDRLVTQDRRAR